MSSDDDSDQDITYICKSKRPILDINILKVNAMNQTVVQETEAKFKAVGLSSEILEKMDPQYELRTKLKHQKRHREEITAEKREAAETAEALAEAEEMTGYRQKWPRSLEDEEDEIEEIDSVNRHHQQKRIVSPNRGRIVGTGPVQHNTVFGGIHSAKNGPMRTHYAITTHNKTLLDQAVMEVHPRSKTKLVINGRGRGGRSVRGGGGYGRGRSRH
eukprot:Tbor_TRINITY_DN4357_c0_g2::TRINITY_DN4357_c0_g2_i1::g.7753::m.7753